MSELKKLNKDPPLTFQAEPLEENIFEWHFTIMGPEDSDFEGGLYHGKLKLPSEYPMKPPKIILLTPSGRWKINSKICLSISDFHPETWQPSWGIRTALTALRAFMPTPGKGAIGSLDASPDARKILAQRSLAWQCKECGICMRDVKKELDELKARGCVPATPSSKDNIPDFSDLRPEEYKTDKPPTIVQDEDLKLEKKDSAEPSTSATAAEETPEAAEASQSVNRPPRVVPANVAQNNASTEESTSPPEHDFLNFLTLFLVTVICSILVKKLFSAFAQAL